MGAGPRRMGVLAARGRAGLLCGWGVAGRNLAVYEAIARIPLGMAVKIEFLGPLAIAIAGSRKVLDFAWVAMAGVGVAILSFAGGNVTPVGVLLALAAAVGWAGYIVLSQRVGRLVPGPNGLAFALAVGGIALLPFGVAGAGGHLLEPRNLLLGLVVAILSTAVPFSLEFAALRRLSAQFFCILMSLEPAMGALAGFVFLTQRLSLRDLLAIALVTAASVGATATAPGRSL